MIELLWRWVAYVVTRPVVRDWIIDRAMRTPYSHIHSSDGERLYMRRWWLFNPFDGSGRGGTYLRLHRWLPVSIRVHHIVRPDEDRHLHDHPWNARTIILKGSYREQREDGRSYHRHVGDTAKLRFGEYHRIDHVRRYDGAWTLFITYRYGGTWGFLVDGKKVPWREYLGVQDSTS